MFQIFGKNDALGVLHLACAGLGDLLIYGALRNLEVLNIINNIIIIN